MTAGRAEDNTIHGKRMSQGDFLYVASNQRAQFLGYLLVDESVDIINNTSYYHVARLNVYERSVIEMAFKTLYFFIGTCLEDFKSKYPNIMALIDPYSDYDLNGLADGAESFLQMNEIEEGVRAFKSGNIYKHVFKSNVLQILNECELQKIHQLSLAQTKQFQEDFEGSAKEMLDYIQRIRTGAKINAADFLMAYAICCYALKCSLRLAVQTMYEAILGDALVVLDNDNVIQFIEQRANVVYEQHVLLMQGALFRPHRNCIGSMILLNCNPTDSVHIKRFGTVVGLEVNYTNEFGSTSKITLATVDDELNVIHKLTDTIINTLLKNNIAVYKDWKRISDDR